MDRWMDENEPSQERYRGNQSPSKPPTGFQKAGEPLLPYKDEQVNEEVSSQGVPASLSQGWGSVEKESTARQKPLHGPTSPALSAQPPLVGHHAPAVPP